jgi:hypothetical protein
MFSKIKYIVFIPRVRITNQILLLIYYICVGTPISRLGVYGLIFMFVFNLTYFGRVGTSVPIPF